MDKRKNNGGKRDGAGRKPKNDEQQLLERLSIYSDDAHKKLQQAVKGGEQWAIKMFFEYYYGKPNQTINHQNNGNDFTNDNEFVLKVISKNE